MATSATQQFLYGRLANFQDGSRYPNGYANRACSEIFLKNKLMQAKHIAR